MKKGVIISLILCATLILFFNQIVSSKDLTVKNYSISTEYPPGGKIAGWISLGVEDISADAILLTSFGETISLLDLLKKQSGLNWACNPLDCNSSYSPVQGSGEASKNFALSAEESETVGIIVSGNSPTVRQQTFSLDIASSAIEDDEPQLFIDLLDDNSPEWRAYLPSGNFINKKYGCYSTISHQQQGNPDSSIGSQVYCEKISLTVSPQVKIGAKVSGSGVSVMQMTIQDIAQSSASGACTNTTDGLGTTEVSCIPKVQSKNYSISEDGDFFVCIKQTSGTVNSYKINRENSAPCGFVGAYSPSAGYTIDFEIFGSSGEFAQLGTFAFKTATAGAAGYSVNLESEISTYISRRYGNDCSDGCVIPLSLNSRQYQELLLYNFKLDVYDSTYGDDTLETLYEVIESPALVNTEGNQSVNLNLADFSVPVSFGGHTFNLTLIDGNENYTLISEDIEIEKIPQVVAVDPYTVAGALPTEFTAIVNTFGSTANVTQYTWNFGDGSTNQTTSTKTIFHTYSQIGTFNLTISVLNSQGLSNRGVFEISVLSPKAAVTKALNEANTKIASIENELKNYSMFSQTVLKQALNLDALSAKLDELKLSSSTATTDQQYLNIMKELVQISLPGTVEETTSATSAPFFPRADNINLDVLLNIGGGMYDATRTSDYEEAIVLWGLDNIKMTTADYSEFSGVYGDAIAPIVNTVKLNVGGIASGSGYLAIPALEGIQFDQTYSQSGGYYYIPLSASPRTVQFATTAPLSPINLPIFIAPSLDEIQLPEGGEETGNKVLILAAVMGGVAFVGLIAYILVGKWYQRRYEVYLFKDRNDLYNIINYVHRLKSKGAKEAEIERNLRKAKWNSEQIKYVIKKYARKKVGIPGFK